MQAVKTLSAPKIVLPPRTVLLSALALAGLFVGIGQYVHLLQLGAWPPHDLTAYWLAGVHLRDGTAPVYTGAVGGYLTFLYAPPWAVLWAVLSLQPLDMAAVTNLVLELLALRYVCGSWKGAALTGWLPFVPQELVTGNMNLVVAAAIYGAARRTSGSGTLVTALGLAKFSPALMLWRASRRMWIEAVIGLGVAFLITLPWLYLWPEWITNMVATITSPQIATLPLLPRLPFVAALLFVRRPWALPLAVALATPAFYIHSTVLLLAPLRVWLERRGHIRKPGIRVARAAADARIVEGHPPEAVVDRVEVGLGA